MIESAPAVSAEASRASGSFIVWLSNAIDNGTCKPIKQILHDEQKQSLEV